MNRILVTGAAGFVGWKTAEILLEQNKEIIGIDNLNDSYDVRLKQFRLGCLQDYEKFSFHKMDIEDYSALESLVKKYEPEAVVNLAARTGVRPSMENPSVYLRTNVLGTSNLLEMCRKYGIGKVVIASSSSVYAGQAMPFTEDLPVNSPISPYAASKKSAEMLCYNYSYHYAVDISVLRYFTVYGPAGRPDMSVFRFIKWIDEGETVQVYGDGGQSRDFTFIDDIARGTVSALKKIGFEIINLGGNKPYTITEIIRMIEETFRKKANIHNLPSHNADVTATWADITKAARYLDWRPSTGIEEGIKKTIQWYREHKLLVSRINV